MDFKRKRIKNTKEIDINLKIESNQATASDYIAKGNINYKKNNSNQALIDYKKAIEIEPSGIVYYKIAQIYQEKNELQLALQNYEEAILLDTSIQDIFYFRGNINYKLKNFKQALQDFSTAINLSPNDYNNLFYRALTYENISDIQNAIADYTKAISISSQNYEAYLNRGKLYLVQDKQQDAIKDFDKAIQLNPELNNQVYKLLDDFNERKNKLIIKKRKEEQIREQKKIELERVKNKISEFNRLMQIGKVHSNRKQYNNAIVIYTKALQLNNQSAEAYFRRGENLWDKGEKTRALSDFNKASKIDEKYKSMMVAIVGVDAVINAGKFIGSLFKKKRN